MLFKILYWGDIAILKDILSLKENTLTHWISVHFPPVFRNKKTIKNLSRLVVRPHTDAVYHACFSENGQRIASCGADKTLQVKYIS
jgi:WD40 repeat protein